MNSMIFKVISFLILTTHNVLALDSFKLQHAGEIGYVSFGVGKNFTKKYFLEFFYGIVPKEINDEKLTTISIKNNYSLFDFEVNGLLSDIYTGVNIYHVQGKKYQTSRDSRFPNEYYRIGSLRGLFYLGYNVSYRDMKHQFYFESGANDIVLTNDYNNENVSFVDHLSLAIGYKYRL